MTDTRIVYHAFCEYAVVVCAERARQVRSHSSVRRKTRRVATAPYVEDHLAELAGDLLADGATNAPQCIASPLRGTEPDRLSGATRRWAPASVRRDPAT
jgi:hypothetical protein